MTSAGIQSYPLPFLFIGWSCFSFFLIDSADDANILDSKILQLYCNAPAVSRLGTPRRPADAGSSGYSRSLPSLAIDILWGNLILPTSATYLAME
jgi:hypothetical protein